MHSIEVLGRPIPWIEVGDQLQGEEFDAFEAGIAAQYKYYVITRTPNATQSTSFPNAAVLANSAAGKSELDFIRYHDGLVQRKIHGTQQTQDKTSGSRGLEEVRNSIADDKTPPAAQNRDQVWTSGALEHIGEVNWPNQPRAIWPVMDSDVDCGKDRLTGPQVIAALAIAEKLRLRQITAMFAVELLVRQDIDRQKAEKMVDSMQTDGELSREVTSAPTPEPKVAQPSGGPDQQRDISHMRQIACDDGTVLAFDTRIPIGTARGDVVWPLAQGDEITSVRMRSEREEIDDMHATAAMLEEATKSAARK
jgi:hypothetical protein